MSQKSYKVQAGSLNAAMRKVKDRFGPDVFVLETRELQRKQDGGLGVRTVFELTVVPGEEYTGDATVRSVEKTCYSGDDLKTLKEEIARLERMVTSVNAVGRRLAGMLKTDGHYPIADILRREGASEKTVEVLTSSFEDQTPGQERQSFVAAANHLGRYVKTVRARSWDQMSGIHVFLGSGGSGKTSLIVKIAGRIADAGGDVAIIKLFPRHSGEIKRFEVVGDALGIEAAVAFSLDEFKKSLKYFQKHKVVLVDTPCILTVKELATDNFRKFLSGLNLAHLHYVFDLNTADAMLETEMELCNHMFCNYAVLTKLDITQGRARLFDLVVRKPLVFSFINGSADFDHGLEIASSRAMLAMVHRTLGPGGDGNQGNPLNYRFPEADEKVKAEMQDRSRMLVGESARKRNAV